MGKKQLFWRFLSKGVRFLPFFFVLRQLRKGCRGGNEKTYLSVPEFFLVRVM